MQMLSCTADERLEAGHRDSKMITIRKENELTGREPTEMTNGSQSQIQEMEGIPENTLEKDRQ